MRTITDREINELQYIYTGLDFGFAVDPAAFIRVAYNKAHDTVYFLNEIYKKHCSNAELAELIKNRGFNLAGRMAGERQLIIADSAEPKSIADLRAAGLKVLACSKYPGSVLYGIKWLQHRKLIIDPKRTPNAYREFTQYEYCTTKDGEFLSDVPDANNHLIDATRYALERLINRRGISA